MGLKRSSVVSIVQRDDMSLSIQPKGIESPERVKKVIIIINQGEKPDSVVRRLVSSYINGYNIIQIRSTEKRIDLETRFAIKDFVRKKLVGTEILSDLPNELTLQILLSYSELSVKDALRRMSIIAASMHRDAVQTLSTDNPRIAKEIVNMDDEVDRFSFYVIRLLNVAVMDAHVLKGERHQNAATVSRLPPHHEVRGAYGGPRNKHRQNRLALHLVPINDEILAELNRISLSAIKVFEASMESLFDEEYSEADSATGGRGGDARYGGRGHPQDSEASPRGGRSAAQAHR